MGRYNRTDTCDKIKRVGYSWRKCGSDLSSGRRERDKNRNWTGNWICLKCYNEDYDRDVRKNDPNSTYNIMKSLGYRKTESLGLDCGQILGDDGEDLLCIWKGFRNLSKENRNARIDCIDEKTDLYYQVKTKRYDHKNGCWNYNFTNLIKSIIEGYGFKSVYLFCLSHDGDRVEKIYELTEDELLKHGTGIKIVNNPTIGRYCTPYDPWYEKYRAKDEGTLKNVNDIWKSIRQERKKKIKEYYDI